MSEAVTLGLDVGGTKVAGGLVSPAGQVLLSSQRPTVVDGLRDPGLAICMALARELVAEGMARGLSVDGIGAGFPEYVDRAGQLRSREVMAWTRQPVDMLAELAPVTVESDVRCAALGEHDQGVARGLPSFAFVITGTGLSYALVEDGRARAGARGEAIALGELEISRAVDAAATGNLESYASGEAIRQRYQVSSGRPVEGAAEVFRLAADGDAVADAILRTAGAALGHGLGMLVRLLDPGAVVMGGGVSKARGPWRAALEAGFAARMASRPEPPPVLWARLGSVAGILGAAIAHRQRVGQA